MRLLFGRSPLSSPQPTKLELGEVSLSKPRTRSTSLAPNNVSAFSSSALSGTDYFSLTRDWPTESEMQLAHDNFKTNEAPESPSNPRNDKATQNALKVLKDYCLENARFATEIELINTEPHLPEVLVNPPPLNLTQEEKDVLTKMIKRAKKKLKRLSKRQTDTTALQKIPKQLVSKPTTSSKSPMASVDVSPSPDLLQKGQPLEAVTTAAAPSQPYHPANWADWIDEANAKLAKLGQERSKSSSGNSSSKTGFRLTPRSLSLDDEDASLKSKRTFQKPSQVAAKKRSKSLSLNEDRTTSLQSLEPSTRPTLRLSSEVSKNLRKQEVPSDQEGRLKTLKEINEKWLQETAPKPTR